MVTSKYQNLAKFLAGEKEDQFRMTFEKIEKLINGPLPRAAREHRAWWANSETNNHAVNGWIQAGWETSRVDMNNRELLFVRKAPDFQFQMAVPSQPGSQDRRVGSPREDLVKTELEEILHKTGGLAQLSHMVDAVERYIQGELLESELGQILRRHWPRRG